MVHGRSYHGVNKVSLYRHAHAAHAVIIIALALLCNIYGKSNYRYFNKIPQNIILLGNYGSSASSLHYHQAITLNLGLSIDTPCSITIIMSHTIITCDVYTWLVWDTHT